MTTHRASSRCLRDGPFSGLVPGPDQDAAEQSGEVDVKGEATHAILAQPLAMKRCLTNLVTSFFAELSGKMPINQWVTAAWAAGESLP